MIEFLFLGEPFKSLKKIVFCLSTFPCIYGVTVNLFKPGLLGILLFLCDCDCLVMLFHILIFGATE